MSTHDFPVQQAEDRLPARRVLLVAAATVVLGCACVLVSWRLGIAAGHGRFVRVATVIAPAPTGTVEVTQTDTKRGTDLVARQRKALTTYGWVDRDHGVG